jgi:ribonuclease P protein component
LLGREAISFRRQSVAAGSVRNNDFKRKNDQVVRFAELKSKQEPLGARGAQALIVESTGFSRKLMAKAPLRLKRRADFLRARQGTRAHARGLVLQAVPRLPTRRDVELAELSAPADSAATGGQSGQAQTLIPSNGGSHPDVQPRFGFTVNKRCGGAVRRNRIRRRLKEALRLLNPLPARLGYDYVIVARPDALDMGFPALQAELRRAFGRAGTLNSPKAQ